MAAVIRDRFQGNNFDGPYTDWWQVTPSDGVMLTELPRALWVGSAGQITVRSRNGSSSVPIIIPVAGTLLKIRPAWVMETGTTASTHLVAFV